jgi:hypothetical protein
MATNAVMCRNPAAGVSGRRFEASAAGNRGHARRRARHDRPFSPAVTRQRTSAPGALAEDRPVGELFNATEGDDTAACAAAAAASLASRTQGDANTEDCGAVVLGGARVSSNVVFSANLHDAMAPPPPPPSTPDHARPIDRGAQAAADSQAASEPLDVTASARAPPLPPPVKAALSVSPAQLDSSAPLPMSQAQIDSVLPTGVDGQYIQARALAEF